MIGNRLWYVTNRCELACLDTEGFLDHQNDGLYQNEVSDNSNEADIVWTLDMMREPACHRGTPAPLRRSSRMGEYSSLRATEPRRPARKRVTHLVSWLSMLAPVKCCGQKSPASNVLDGQWGSPAYGVVNGVAQVVFPGGDGWVYSFDPAGAPDGKSKLLWRFDCNAKTSKYDWSGRGTRNQVIAAPLFHQGHLFVAAGQNPELGEGESCVWCIDPTKRGDLSPELVFNDKNGLEHPIPHKRLIACEPDKGDFVQANPNSGVIWKYAEQDDNGNGDIEFGKR